MAKTKQNKTFLLHISLSQASLKRLLITVLQNEYFTAEPRLGDCVPYFKLVQQCKKLPEFPFGANFYFSHICGFINTFRGGGVYRKDLQ